MFFCFFVFLFFCLFKRFQKISGLALLDDQGQVCFDFGAEEVRTLDANKLSKLDTETVWDFVNHVCVVVSLHSCCLLFSKGNMRELRTVPIETTLHRVVGLLAKVSLQKVII